MPATAPAPRRRRPEFREPEILDAAYHVFGQVGFAAARLDDVARRAGVSKGTLYLYFDSKDALFRAMVRHRIVGALADLEQHLVTGTPRERLERFMQLLWERVCDPGMVGISRLVQGELHSFPELARFYYDEVILRVRGILQRLMQEGVATGAFRAEQAEFAARAIPSMLVTFAKQLQLFGPLDPTPLDAARMGAGIVDLVLHGVLARSAPAA